MIGALVALASLSIPLSVHANPGTKAALASMHLIAGVCFVVAMGRARLASRPSHADRAEDVARGTVHGQAA